MIEVNAFKKRTEMNVEISKFTELEDKIKHIVANRFFIKNRFQYWRKR